MYLGPAPIFDGQSRKEKTQAEARRWYDLLRLPDRVMSPAEKKELESLTDTLESRLKIDAPWFMWLLEQDQVRGVLVNLLGVKGSAFDEPDVQVDECDHDMQVYGGQPGSFYSECSKCGHEEVGD